MGIGTDEQETVVQFNRNGKTATIYTSDSTIMTKLDKLVGNGYYSVQREVKNEDGLVVAKFYSLLDKSLVSFRSSKTTRVLTDEQRKAMGERFKAMRGKREWKYIGVVTVVVNAAYMKFKNLVESFGVCHVQKQCITQIVVMMILRKSR